MVATARNDDHGGNLLRRMQVFVDAWINQAKRHQLASELILVEWNPPQDRKRLATALRWPRDTGPCQVRIIEVPADVHARYHHASALALYQMIAKNVGIRRARGEFILATNIDIVFSDELMEYLAAHRLEKGRTYRIDRSDVMSDVPVNGTIDEQLAYCRSHVIRLCAREGTFSPTPEGFRKNALEDITGPGSGIYFGSGWFPVERWGAEEPFRWIADEAEIILSRTPPGSGVLELDLEEGPGIERNAPVLQVLDEAGSLVAEWIVQGRSKLELVLPPAQSSGKQSFRLRVGGGGSPLADDPRILNFRVFRCDWAEFHALADRPVPALSLIRQSRPMLTRFLAAWRASHGFVSLLLRSPGILRRAIRLLAKRGADVFEAGMEYRLGQGWHELENAGGERFRWISQDAQLAVRVTDVRRSLALIVEPGPELGFQPFTLLIRDASGEVIGRAPVSGMTYVDVALPMRPGTLATLVFTAEGGGIRVGDDPRLLSIRVHACGGGVQTVQANGSLQHTAPRFWIALNVGSVPGQVKWAEVLEKWRTQIASLGKPAFLHMNACGDFTLMARENWHNLRGYPELDLFSMHLDSLLCCAAHHAGVLETMLLEPFRIYHVEHGIGSGWTPEGETQLYERLTRKGIQSVSYDEVVWSIAQMRGLRAPLIFNLDDWGCAKTAFNEICPTSVPCASGIGR